MSAGKGDKARNCHSKKFKDNYDNIFNKRNKMDRPLDEISSPVDGKVKIDFFALPKCQQEMIMFLEHQAFLKKMNDILRDTEDEA